MPKKKPPSQSIPKKSDFRQSRATGLPRPLKTKVKATLPKKLPYKGWRLEHGVSQSLLQKFLVDTDRYHKRTVLGLKPTDRKEAMEYGSLFHKLIEEGARMGNKFSMIKLISLMRIYSKERNLDPVSDHLLQIALVQYEEYHKWQLGLPRYKYIDQEPVFAETYTLPATIWNPCPEIDIRIPRTEILLRGRIDEVIDLNGELYLQENKTKGRIDISLIQDTVPENLQVMFYAVAASLKYGKPVKGFIYNIIRKPGQRQKVKESNPEYYQRIREEIQENPAYYFYRLAYSFPANAIKRWEREELIPLLYRLYLWWKSIEKNPTNPWGDENGNINPFHGRKPFGVYDPMVLGKGEYFELIVHGLKINLVVDHQQFGELIDEENKDNTSDD